MTEPKPLILNLFEMACISHISHGLWSLPGNNRHRFDDLEPSGEAPRSVGTGHRSPG